MTEEVLASGSLAGARQRDPAGGAPWLIDCLLKTLLLAAAYCIIGRLGLLLAIPPGYATAVWPPSGIALAGILLWGPRVWPGIWLGSILVNVWVALAAPNAEISSTGLAVAVSIGVGSTLQALLGAFLLKHWVGTARLFERGTAILAFAAIAALACLLASTWGVVSLVLAGIVDWASFFEAWRTWWLGDLIGVLVVTPVLLTWRGLSRIDRRPWRLVEAIGSLALFTLLTVAMFVGPSPLGRTQYPLAFLPLPCLVWIAFRFVPGSVALATLLLSGIAVCATSLGFGPFVRDITHESLLMLQAFTGLATLTGLTLAAAVTGHKQAETALREQEAKYRDLYDHAPDMFVSVDAVTATIIECNHTLATVLGYTKAELLGRPIVDLYHPACMENVRKALHAFQTSGEVHDAELQLKRKDGSTIEVSLNVSALRDDQGRILHSRSVWRDITKRKRAEDEVRKLNAELEARVRDRTAQLEELARQRKHVSDQLTEKSAELTRSNAELQQFAYVASHDLKEPLRMVANFTQLLARRYKGKLDQDADEFIGFAVDGAQRMQVLIDDLLAMSRVDSRRKAFVPVDCNALLDQVASDMQVAVRDAGGEVTWGDLPRVLADDVQLGQVFQNLIGNALKFRGQDPPRIRVSAERNESVWQFSVRDNGIGIDPQFNERIFIIFQRLHNKDEYPGTGIGLALCKKIIERHGGKIWVESQPGAGATFHFTIQDQGEISR